MRAVKQSTARTIMVLMVDSTDHVTGKTGLSLTITASKAGAAFASISPTVTERGSGWYSLTLTTAHLDTLGDFALHITGVAADPADLLLEVVAYNPEDAAGLGLSRIDAAVSTRSTLAAGALMGLADDAITSAKIAAGAITSSEAPALANLDAAVSTRLATAGYTAPANSDITAIKAKTDNLPVDPADESSLQAAIATRLASASYTAPDNAGIAATQAAAESVNARLPADPADESLLEAAIATRAAPGAAMTLSASYDAAKTSAQAGDPMALSAGAVDAILDEAVEGSVTLRQALRIVLAVLAGKVTGAPGGPLVYRDLADTKARVTGVVDASGNRTLVTLDGE